MKTVEETQKKNNKKLIEIKRQIKKTNYLRKFKDLKHIAEMRFTLKPIEDI